MFCYLLGIDSWPYKIGNEGIGGVKYSEKLKLMVLSMCVLVLFDGRMLSTCCIGFIWWMHDSPPVVFSCFWHFTGFVYVWKLSWSALLKHSTFLTRRKRKKHFTVGLKLYWFSPWSVNPAQHLSLGLNLYSWIYRIKWPIFNIGFIYDSVDL